MAIEDVMIETKQVKGQRFRRLLYSKPENRGKQTSVSRDSGRPGTVKAINHYFAQLIKSRLLRSLTETDGRAATGKSTASGTNAYTLACYALKQLRILH
jgi:hypothetical protein